jgi:signal transduction histidine kinase
MLDDLGLGSALQWQARQFSKHTGIPVNITVENVTADLPEQHRTCIYRFVQEALTNCARHAHAKTIEVTLRSENGQLAVAVRDEGMGFDVLTVWGKGLGLIGLEERVRELGGDVTLTSELRRGTMVSAIIPVAIEERQNEYSHSSGR